MYQQVANILRDRIAYGIYPKDELLPPEMLLLSEFNVSRHTIREAMRMLVGEGLIERLRHPADEKSARCLCPW